MAILGAMVSAAAGATVGHALLNLTSVKHVARPWLRSSLALGAIAGGFLLLVLALNLLAVPMGIELPLIKRLWSAPYALVVAALTASMLLLGHLLLDRDPVDPRVERVSGPLIALGRNSLLVYFGSHILMSLLRRPLGEGPSVVMLYQSAWPSPVPAQVVWSLALLAFWIVLAVVLHRREIYLRP